MMRPNLGCPGGRHKHRRDPDTPMSRPMKDEPMRPTHPTVAPDAPETEVVSKMRISCDGGGGALGHPRVWLTINRDTGMVECPYCDKKFIHEDWT